MRILDTNGVVITSAFTPVNMTVKEIDGSPSITNCNDIIVPNGTLTNLGFGKAQFDASAAASSVTVGSKLRLARGFA